MIESDYSACRRIAYGSDGEQATFIPVCEKCGRFVKADAIVRFTYDGPPENRPNATCSKCGRTKMLFEGYL